MKRSRLRGSCDVVAVRGEKEDEDSCCRAACQLHSSECITWPQVHYSQYKNKRMVLFPTGTARFWTERVPGMIRGDSLT